MEAVAVVAPAPSLRPSLPAKVTSRGYTDWYLPPPRRFQSFSLFGSQMLETREQSKATTSKEEIRKSLPMPKESHRFR